MATELGKAYVQIMPSAKGISGAIQNQLAPEATAAGKASGGLFGKGLALAATTAISAAGIGKFISASISEGANLQQSLGGIETLFKGSADKVKQYASEAYKTSGLSANAYMETVTSFSASLLQSLGGDTEKAAETANMALIDMSDNANKMGTSMESIQMAYQGFAKQNYTMLDNLKLGYGGTKTEMERLLKDAQKLTGVKYDINSLDDVYKAIHVIQEELDITGTTAKEAASTFSGSFASMKAAFSNVLGGISLGKDISSELNALAETTSTFLFKNLIPMIGNVLSGLPQALVTFIKAGIPLLVQAGGDLINSLLQGFQSSYSDFNIVVLNLTSDIISWLKQEFPAMMEMGVEFLTMIGTGFIQAAPDLLITFTYLLEDLFVALVTFAPVLLQGAVDLFLNLLNGLSQTSPDFLVAFDEILRSMIDTISGTVPQFLEKGVEIVLNLVQGIIDNLPTIGSTVIQMISMFIDVIVQNLPSFLRTGWEILQSLVKGILSKLPDLTVVVIKLIVEFVSTIVSKFPQILSVGADVLKTFVSGVLSIIGDVVSTAGKVGQALIDEISRIDLWSAGKAIMDGFLNGLTSAWSNVQNFVGGIADWISQNKGPISYDKRLLIPHGKAMMSGLGRGLTTGFKQVKQNVTSMAGELSDLFETEMRAVEMSTSTIQNLDMSMSTQFIDDRLTNETDRMMQLMDKLVSRPIVVSNQIDKREFSQLIAEPIAEEQARRETVLNAINGKGW